MGATLKENKIAGSASSASIFLVDSVNIEMNFDFKANTIQYSRKMNSPFI
jgi:hypothetical protein